MIETNEITLEKRQPLNIHGNVIGTLERLNGTDELKLKLNDEKGITLKEVIDRSESIGFSRVFTIQSMLSKDFIIFGGEKMYRLSLLLNLRGAFPRTRKLF